MRYHRPMHAAGETRELFSALRARNDVHQSYQPYQPAWSQDRVLGAVPDLGGIGSSLRLRGDPVDTLERYDTRVDGGHVCRSGNSGRSEWRVS